MILSEIKKAVELGMKVNWKSSMYSVVEETEGALLVVCKDNGTCHGLVYKNGLQGNPLDFYVNGFDSTQLRSMFLDYFNNYLTVSLWCEHNQISLNEGENLIKLGRLTHENYCKNPLK